MAGAYALHERGLLADFRMSHTYRTAALSLLLLLAAVLPLPASAATLSFTPSAGSFEMGKNFTVRLTVDPASTPINASDGTVAFDASTLSVVSVSKDGSAFSLWTADPKYSNADGTIEFSGGTPSPVSGKGTVISITFKPKKTGNASVSISKGSILAADGKGTDVYESGSGATFTITDAAPAEPPPAADDTVSSEPVGLLPIAPVVTSSSHSKPDSWYGTSTATFSWKPTADVTAVRTGISDQPDAQAKEQQKADVETQTYTELSDGSWYFAIQYKNDSGWGPTTHMKINIDTVPPKEFDIALAEPSSAGDVAKLTFTAEDELSGMGRYEVLFGTTTVGSVKAKDFDGTFTIPPQGGGETSVTVKAFDAAGNVREVTRTFTLPKVDKPVAVDETAPKQSSNWPEHILVIVLSLAFGGLFAWYYKAGKDAEAERARMLAHVVDVREKNDRVFSAMREEFEQMVQDFDEKPQLTPAERDLLEGIREVLDISEGLLDSSLEELKREVRGK